MGKIQFGAEINPINLSKKLGYHVFIFCKRNYISNKNFVNVV